MARLVNRAIPPPVLGPGRVPLRFRWAGRVYQVAAVLDTWQDTGAWWEGEPEKTFWRVEVAGGGIFELWQDARGRWAVYRIWD